MIYSSAMCLYTEIAIELTAMMSVTSTCIVYNVNVSTSKASRHAFRLCAITSRSTDAHAVTWYTALHSKRSHYTRTDVHICRQSQPCYHNSTACSAHKYEELLGRYGHTCLHWRACIVPYLRVILDSTTVATFHFRKHRRTRVVSVHGTELTERSRLGNFFADKLFFGHSVAAAHRHGFPAVNF